MHPLRNAVNHTLRLFNLAPVYLLTAPLFWLLALTGNITRRGRIPQAPGYVPGCVWHLNPFKPLTRFIHSVAPSWMGITIGNQIVLAYVGKSNEREMTVHENIHVRQWQNAGIFFALIYLYDLVKHGYYGVRYEREAYSKQRLLRDTVQE